MPFISEDDVAAFAKRERYHRTLLAGLIIVVLASALSTILPTFKSQITSITSDSRLLGLRDVCGGEGGDPCPNDPNKDKPGLCGCGFADTDMDRDGTPDCKDDCPHDATKTSPGACGCGVPDTDRDGDGTLDCKDGCPRDASKTSPGICGCGISDTDWDGDGTPDCKDVCSGDASKTSPGICGCYLPDIDTDGDGTLDCHDRCPHDVNKISLGSCGCGIPDTDKDGDGTPNCHSDCLSSCEFVPGYSCEGCDGKYKRVWKEWGLMCLCDIDYCLDYRDEAWYMYDDSQYYTSHRYYERIIQTGADSSNSILEYRVDCNNDFWTSYWLLNSVPCSVQVKDRSLCLVCDDGNEYCMEAGVPPLPSSPWFYTGIEAVSRLAICLGWDTATTNEFEMKPLGNSLARSARDFFNNGP